MAKLHLFEGVGIELEYMIADADSLNVRAEAELLLRNERDEVVNEIETRPIGISNELVAHVIELKTTDPLPLTAETAADFHKKIVELGDKLAPRGLTLLGTAMHPWMDPNREKHLWPHENKEIYDLYDTIFDCRGHGWANLQSMHINLPFYDDSEFWPLHTAIRTLLPILPALAASSPIADGEIKGPLDFRLMTYRGNQAKIPSIAGLIVPEAVRNEDEYRQRILKPMYAAIAPYDKDGILQHEWLNSRGAIGRWDRNAIEIRVIDLQECPAADTAIAWAAIHAVRWLTEGGPSDAKGQEKLSTGALADLLEGCIRNGEKAVIDNPAYLELWGLEGRKAMQAGELWRHIITQLDNHYTLSSPFANGLETILSKGTLSIRILKAVEAQGGGMQAIRGVYGNLADCLRENLQLQ